MLPLPALLETFCQAAGCSEGVIWGFVCLCQSAGASWVGTDFCHEGAVNRKGEKLVKTIHCVVLCWILLLSHLFEHHVSWVKLGIFDFFGMSNVFCSWRRCCCSSALRKGAPLLLSCCCGAFAVMTRPNG